MERIAILGMGNLGSQISYLLKNKIGSNNLYPTLKTKERIRKLKKKFPNISNNNTFATKASDIILLITQPQDVGKVISEINPALTKEKILINFTPKKIELDSPVINVASSPVINNKIKILMYNPNKKTSKAQVDKFKKFFRPLTNNLSKCKDTVKELSMMSRVYSHTLNYYQLLIKEGNSSEKIKLHFELAFDTLKNTESVEVAILKAKTKKGITESLFELYKEKDFKELVKKEKEVINKKVKSLQDSQESYLLI